MKLVKVCFAIVIFVAISNSSLCLASVESHRAAIEKMLQLSNVGKIIQPVFAKIEGILQNQFQQMGASEEKKPIFEKYNKKIFNLMKEEMSWSKMRDDFIDIYAKVYTEEEINEINKFYSSPTGRKMIEQMPFLMQEALTITQKHLRTVLPEIQKISKDMSSEIKNSK